ncbi:division/cell wall cluster transcriptional repressor MraZ [Roseomonas sp. GC11]|uniref:division/cell wall cluster transcriptional repressor MraZ n=1 Tax=Roseomonas sp. GC11 TaxID=2950546 RepID=UPI00210E26C3|nr:division/cell wall cluster transcriptional repressor MraZ [Roseomonas sp. GC11]MCQ4162501.1 division/cell wall cluster transcriptional repressor MraZ [Roseomonas sp. GC11]
MTRFMGTHTNRLDRKGRVSVPAPFRAELARLGTEEMVLRPSHRATCIEAWPLPAFEEMAGGIDQFDIFSDAQDDMAAALFADAHPMRPDGEGRIMLPEELIAHAGLGETITFLGLGRIFQLWEPEAAKRHVEESRARARERALTLPALRPGTRPAGGAA